MRLTNRTNRHGTSSQRSTPLTIGHNTGWGKIPDARVGSDHARRGWERLRSWRCRECNRLCVAMPGIRAAASTNCSHEVQP